MNMDADEKRRFIADLCENYKRTLLGAVPNMPQEWDGIEIRELLACIADNSRADFMRSRKDKRRRDFDNERIVRNLP